MDAVMTEKLGRYERGKNPESLKNLQHLGRKPIYDEKKENRTVRVTPTAWNALKDKAATYGLTLGELLERFARESEIE